jgi:hypothetical protein
MRFTTDARSVKNHPVYLFNYIHCVPTAGATSPDSPSSGLTSTWNTRAAILVAGYSDGTLTRKRAGPNGAVAQAGATLTYLHHRDFPT